MHILWRIRKILLFLGTLVTLTFGDRVLAGDFVYVMENAGTSSINNLTKVDFAKGKIVWRKKTKYKGLPGYIAVDPKGGKIYIYGAYTSSPLVKVDMTSGEVEASLALDLLDQINGPIRLSADQDKVLILNAIKEKEGKIEGKMLLLDAKDLTLIKSIPTDHIESVVFCAEQDLLYAESRDRIIGVELMGGNIFAVYDLPPSIADVDLLFLTKGCDELLFKGYSEGSEKVSLWQYDLKWDSAQLLSSDFRDIPIGIRGDRIFALPKPDKGKAVQSKALQSYDKEVLRLKKFRLKDREIIDEGEEAITLEISETLKRMRQEKIRMYSKRASGSFPEERKDVEWWKSHPLLSVSPSGAINPGSVTLPPSGDSITWLIDYRYREPAYLNIIFPKDKKIRTIHIGQGTTNIVFTSE